MNNIISNTIQHNEIKGERFYLGCFPINFLCNSSCAMCDKDPEYYAAWLFFGDSIVVRLCKNHAKFLDKHENGETKTDKRYIREGRKEFILKS